MSPEERGGRGSERSTSGDAPEEETRSRTDGHEGPQRGSGEDFAHADPDVLLDVPKIHVEELSLEVDDLKARVALQTRLSDLLDIEVGLDVSLSAVKLETKGVEAEAQLKARLENVQAMVERTLSSVDANPGLIKDLTNLSKSSSGNDGQPALEESDSSKEITEAAVKKAEELGIDPYSLEGTGSRGRVIFRDVQRAYRDS
jgi:pyruvate/2-oxoglutarate dehydrogenase complex dihydrolipoamide acyltransferase (E2) component